MKKTLNSAFLLILLFLAGCASQVAIDYNQKQSFKHLKSFQIIPPKVINTEDTRLNSPLVISRFSRTIQTYLESRNYQSVTNNADFKVSFILQSKQEVRSDNHGMNFTFGHGFGSHSRGGFGMIYSFPNNEVYSYDKVIITIDILAQNNQLIWRGSSSHLLDSSSTAEKNDQTAKKIIADILGNFPPPNRE